MLLVEVDRYQGLPCQPELYLYVTYKCIVLLISIIINIYIYIIISIYCIVLL